MDIGNGRGIQSKLLGQWCVDGTLAHEVLSCPLKNPIKGSNSSLNTQGAPQQHNPQEFDINCLCSLCAEYRELVRLAFDDQQLSASVWIGLKSVLQKYYIQILSEVSSSLVAVYRKLTANSKIGWQSNGVINTPKKEYLKLMSGVTSDEAIVVFNSALLLKEDPHQLFELLAYESECFARCYVKGITERRHTPSYGELPPEDRINYILGGYKKICEVCQKTGALLHTFENEYLKQFDLTWQLLNKRMYEKWVFAEISETAVQLIFKMKGQVSNKHYLTTLSNYINLCDDMLDVKIQWKCVWHALNKRNMSENEVQRRVRVRTLHKTFELIAQSVSEENQLLVDWKEWETCKNRNAVWESLKSAVKKKWKKSDSKRISSSLHLGKCVSCNTSTDNHKASCNCVTCLIAGPYYSASEDILKTMCFKCAQVQEAVGKFAVAPPFINNLKKVLRDEDKTSANKKARNQVDEIFHISWKVFKNSEDRKMYTRKDSKQLFYCKNCTRNDCKLARKIINSTVAAEWRKIAITYYQPLFLNNTELDKSIPSVANYLKNINSVKQNLPPHNCDPVCKGMLLFCCNVLIRHRFRSVTDCKEADLVHFSIDDDIESDIHDIDDRLLDKILNTFSIYLKNIDLGIKDDVKELTDSMRKNFISCVDKKDILHQKTTEPLNRTEKGKNADEPELQYNPPLEENVCRDVCFDDMLDKDYDTDMKISNIQATISYLEEDEKKRCANKKAIKKNRQKLKKEELKRVEELQNLKSQYQDTYFKEFFLKKALKDLKSTKKKDKKKTIELEYAIKKLNVTKLKIEKNILESLQIVKSINADFKLAYLPTKEQLESALENYTSSSSKTQSKHKNPPQDMTLTSSDSLLHNNNLVQDESSRPAFELNNLPEASKRIVTIRRINDPHVSEPQVTVTAKGNFPEEDKLLYTFINGQIVPTSSSQSFKPLKSTSFVEKNDASIRNFAYRTDCCTVYYDPKTKPMNRENSTENMQQRSQCHTDGNSVLDITKSKYLFDGSRSHLDKTPCAMNDGDQSRIEISRNNNPNNVSNLFAYAQTDRPSLCTSLKQVSLFSETKKQTSKNNTNENPSYAQVNISIMDQINKGIQVENLMLPPGITLTKVDPSKSEKVKADRELIDKLSFHVGEFGAPRPNYTRGYGDFIQSTDNSSKIQPTVDSSKKKRKKCKTSRKLTNEEDPVKSNIITLHNPIFHLAKDVSLADAESSLKIRSLSMDQPASIIQNENGMFTIRSPALHNTLMPNKNNKSYTCVYMPNTKYSYKEIQQTGEIK